MMKLSILIVLLLGTMVFAAPADYFDADEYRTISNAAKRNDCTGDMFLILLAIRKAENGKVGDPVESPLLDIGNKNFLYERDLTGSWTKRNVNTAELAKLSIPFTKEEQSVSHASAKVLRLDMKKREILYVLVDENVIETTLRNIENLNGKIIKTTAKSTKSEPDDTEKSIRIDVKSVIEEDTKGESERFWYTSNLNGVVHANDVDMKRTWRRCTGITEISPLKSLGLVSYGFQKETLKSIWQKSKNATCFVLIVIPSCINHNLKNDIGYTESYRLVCSNTRVVLCEWKEVGGLEFGVLHPKAKNTNLNTQAGWAAATVTKNFTRWKKAETQQPFIRFLGNRYCPVGVLNDPNGLNDHWVRNVTTWYLRFKKEQ